jgi:hypothetical protein
MTIDHTKSWFLSKLPKFSIDLQKVINDAYLLLVKSKAATLAVSSSSSKLKGFATISVNSIIKGEFTLTSPKYNRGHHVKLTISGDHHVKLPQITTAKNCLEKCLYMLKGMNGADLNSVIRVVDQILTLIQQAKSSLAEPDQKSKFPSAHRPVFADGPIDCAADFTIQFTQLVTTIHCLHFADNAFEQAMSHLKSLQTVK